METKEEEKFARELALTISFRIIGEEKLQDLSVKQMVLIRDMVEEETIALFKDFEKKTQEDIEDSITRLKKLS